VALPVVGAIAGGPVGAAAGLVVQNLFRKQIGEAAQSRYKVSGSWAQPKIELIGREPVSGVGKESAKPEDKAAPEKKASDESRGSR
ncbi:MAG: AsmA-like C-terminal region-containing protein, partial [Dokdonella sp.]